MMLRYQYIIPIRKEVYSEILGSGNMYIDHATNERTSNSFEINWDFRDTDGKIHNNAAYTIWVTAKTPLSDKYSSKVVTQSFTIDTEKPVINNCSKLIIGDTEYLMIEAADNGTLQGAVSYDSKSMNHILCTLLRQIHRIKITF